jgi:hypothetical protein
VFLASSGGPAFDFWSFDFDGAAAATADQVVVVVAARAAAVASFAVVAAEGVELAGIGEHSDLVVDGGEGDVLALGLQLGVKLLSRAEAVGAFQDGGKGALLPRRALLRRPTRLTVSVGADHHDVSTEGSVVVPVPFVRGMAVPVVDVVDVVAVGDGDMSAAFPVGVIVSRVLGVALDGALIEVPVVGGVKMPVVDVVDVVAVGDGDMSAAFPVDMGVVGVLEVSSGHGCSSWECRMASLTM